MDCRHVRQLLICTREGDLATLGQNVLDHLENCTDCLAEFQRGREFDETFRTSLLQCQPPRMAEQRCLDAIAQYQQSVVQRSAWRKGRLLALAIAACLVTAASATIALPWLQRPRFATAVHQIEKEFSRPDPHAWADRPYFDANFSIEDRSGLLRGFRLTPPRGLDLDHDGHHDVAILEFERKSWRGVVAVLPTHHYRGGPKNQLPRPREGESALEWTSTDGSLTFVCVVLKGDLHALAQELFRRWT